HLPALQLQQQQRAPGHQELAVERVYLVARQLGTIGVQQAVPAATLGHLGQQEIHRVLVGVDDDQQGHVGALAPDAGGLGATIQQHAHAAGVGVVPVLLAHFAAVRHQPGNVLDAQLLVVVADQEASPPQDRVAARSEEHTSELQSRENLVCRLLLEKKKKIE